MYYDPVKVEYIKDYILKVEFKDGSGGEVDFSNIIESVKPYQKLSDIDLFKKAYIHPEIKVIYWDDELDYDPLILYYKANKLPFPAEWGVVA